MIIVVETFLAHRHTLLTLFFGDSGKGRISNIGSSKLIDQGMYSVTQELCLMVLMLEIWLLDINTFPFTMDLLGEVISSGLKDKVTGVLQYQIGTEQERAWRMKLGHHYIKMGLLY